MEWPTGYWLRLRLNIKASNNGEQQRSVSWRWLRSIAFVDVDRLYFIPAPTPAWRSVAAISRESRLFHDFEKCRMLKQRVWSVSRIKNGWKSPSCQDRGRSRPIFYSILVTAAIGSRPKPEIYFLPEQLRWMFLPRERYDDSLSGPGVEHSTFWLKTEAIVYLRERGWLCKAGYQRSEALGTRTDPGWRSTQLELTFPAKQRSTGNR